MYTTSYPDVDALLTTLATQIQKILGKKLVGLYVYGSLVSGDFDHDISDLDMLAVVSADIDERELKVLTEMHHDTEKEYPAWKDRIEVQYFSVAGLAAFKSRPSPMAVISPGEPLHMVDAGVEWLLNWYFVEKNGVAIVGPSASRLIPDISKNEFWLATREQAREWREYVKRTKNSRHYQGYAILTMCRALYTVRIGE